MTKPGDEYDVVPFPRMRQLIVDSGRLAKQKHRIRALVEFDVTKARSFINEHKARTGETLSFTAYVIFCLSRAVEADKNIHAYRNWRNNLIMFKDVDVLTYVEVVMDGNQFPLAHIVRAANRKSWHEIHEEIRSVQADPEKGPKARQRQTIEWILLLPSFFRDIVYRLVNRRPHLWKQQVGTVYLTSVGMFGKGSGWGIAFSAHTLGIVLGGIRETPVVIDGRVEVRECLNVTADFDHDLIDGGPAARFIEHFKKLIENGHGLENKTQMGSSMHEK
ncbi:MAG: dehydrogenase [Acidobacteria bacterium]|nr:dehydrogenase [Acidobacteriota bacterium]